MQYVPLLLIVSVNDTFVSATNEHHDECGMHIAKN
jgi:hypothetical protein